MLTNEIYKEYKEYKGLRKENLRDNMTNIEVLLTDIGEVTTRELAKKHKPQGFNANKRVAKNSKVLDDFANVGKIINPFPKSIYPQEF